MEELLRQHMISTGTRGSLDLSIGENKISVLPSCKNSSSFLYKRLSAAGEVISQFMLASDKSQIAIGIFPEPGLLTPKHIANNVYLKFRSPIIVDQKSDAVLYATMPIDIAVYRQSADEEILLDGFSLGKQQYALYGSPECGVLCRYKQVDSYMNKDELRPTRYEEALVRIAIRNDIDNVVKIHKVIFPIDNVILDHAHDDSWLPGTVEMRLDQAFGKDVINVRLVNTKIKPADKTSVAQKEDSMVFLMDAGY